MLEGNLQVIRKEEDSDAILRCLIIKRGRFTCYLDNRSFVDVNWMTRIWLLETAGAY